MKKTYEIPLMDQLNLTVEETISNVSGGNDFPKDNEVGDLEI